MGTPALAAHILSRIAAASSDNFRVAAVVTRPDTPRGRKLVMEPSEVGAVAARLNIPTLKPLKIRTPEFLAELKSFAPDVLIVAAYGRILPNEILAAPTIAPINVHASLLPRHRGAAPVEGAILSGDSETGVTIMRIVERMDSGPMFLKRTIPIATTDTQGTLKEKLAELGADAMLEALELLRRGELRETPQDDALATYTKPIKKSDSVIDWNSSAVQIERAVRAYDPWPVARTTFRGETILVWRSAAVSAGLRGVAGTVVSVGPDVLVQCGDGRLRMMEVQEAGRKRIAAAEFVRGKRIETGMRFGM